MGLAALKSDDDLCLENFVAFGAANGYLNGGAALGMYGLESIRLRSVLVAPGA